MSPGTSKTEMQENKKDGIKYPINMGSHVYSGNPERGDICEIIMAENCFKLQIPNHRYRKLSKH